MSDKDKEQINDLEPQKDAKGGFIGDSEYDVKGKKPGGDFIGDSEYDVKPDNPEINQAEIR